MGIEEVVAVFVNENQFLALLPKDAVSNEENKANWQLPRVNTAGTTEKDYITVFSENYGISVKNIKTSIIDRARGFVMLNFKGEDGKQFDTFDMSMVKINPSKYKAAVLVGKEEANEILTEKDRNLLNSYY